MVKVPGKLRVALHIPYLNGGATKQPVFLATSRATYSGWMLSVQRGKWSPCSSTLPIGKITTASSFAAFSASFVLNSSSQRHCGFWVLCAGLSFGIVVCRRMFFFYLVDVHAFLPIRRNP